MQDRLTLRDSCFRNEAHTMPRRHAAEQPEGPGFETYWAYIWIPIWYKARDAGTDVIVPDIKIRGLRFVVLARLIGARGLAYIEVSLQSLLGYQPPTPWA